jgi:hypothetical protein
MEKVSKGVSQKTPAPYNLKPFQRPPVSRPRDQGRHLEGAVYRARSFGAPVVRGSVVEVSGIEASASRSPVSRISVSRIPVSRARSQGLLERSLSLEARSRGPGRRGLLKAPFSRAWTRRPDLEGPGLEALGARNPSLSGAETGSGEARNQKGKGLPGLGVKGRLSTGLALGPNPSTRRAQKGAKPTVTTRGFWQAPHPRRTSGIATAFPRSSCVSYIGPRAARSLLGVD